MTHSSEDDVLPDGNLVSRKLFTLMIEPLLDAGHAQGTYSLKITYTVTADAPPADHNKAHLWCKYINKDCRFEVGAIDQQLFPNVSAEDRFLINPPAGADYTIAVAAYDPRDDPNFAVAGFSSSGPLANYGSGVQPPPKPDLAAPGVKIHAACSRDYHPLEPTLEYLGASTTVMHGTSMAAPHVTGAVALILQKDPNASAKAVDAYLKLGATTYPQPQPEQAGVGRLDAKETFDVAP